MGWREEGNTLKLVQAHPRLRDMRPPSDHAVLSKVREGVQRIHRGLAGLDILRAHCGAGVWEVPVYSNHQCYGSGLGLLPLVCPEGPRPPGGLIQSFIP